MSTTAHATAVRPDRTPFSEARAAELKAIYARYDGTTQAAEIVIELARGRQAARSRPETEDAHPSARGQLA